MSGGTRGLQAVSVGGTSFSVRPHYSTFKVIGRGSYGVVVSCTDGRTKGRCAIKRIKPMAGHVSDAKHALREIRCMRLGAARHPVRAPTPPRGW